MTSDAAGDGARGGTQGAPDLAWDQRFCEASTCFRWTLLLDRGNIPLTRQVFERCTTQILAQCECVLFGTASGMICQADCKQMLGKYVST